MLLVHWAHMFGTRPRDTDVGFAHLEAILRIAGGTPNGIRTRVAAVKGRNPRPLDDGSERACAMLARLNGSLPQLFETLKR
jgi:hypothetical protein